MLLNYHELTMGESKNSPAKTKQFRVICLVMAICVVYTLITSGALRPVEVYEGQFPGGEFIYKTTGRDYAASMSLTERVARDLSLKESHYGNTMYNLYLDDPLAVNGRRQRFASGILLNEATSTPKQESNEERKKVLMDIDAEVVPATKKERAEMAAWELWPKLNYHTVQLPSVKAAVVEYTFSNGFVSALLHSYKVFPAIRQYAKDHGAPGMVPVVVTNCHIKENKCFHYVPLADAENVFRLGKREYDATEGGGHINWAGVRKMLLKLLSFGQMGGDQAPVKIEKQEEEITVKKAPPPMESTTTTTSQEAPVGEAPDSPVEEETSEQETPAIEEPPVEETPEEPPVEETSEQETAATEEAPVEEAEPTENVEAVEVPVEESSETTADENTNQHTEDTPVEQAAPVEEETVDVQDHETTTHEAPMQDEAVQEEVIHAEEVAPENPPLTDEATQEMNDAQDYASDEIQDPPVQEESSQREEL